MQKDEDDVKPIVYKAKDFVVNFLQVNMREDEDPTAKMNEKLDGVGLAKVWKHENKQRAIIFATINEAANNELDFASF